MSSSAEVKLAAGVPFDSDADLEEAPREAGPPQEQAQAVVEANQEAAPPVSG